MRVERGGHSISPDVLKRRYPRSIQNFLKEYQPLADRWILFDNSGPKIRVIAEMDSGCVSIIDESTYNELISRYEKEN